MSATDTPAENLRKALRDTAPIHRRLAWANEQDLLDEFTRFKEHLADRYRTMEQEGP